MADDPTLLLAKKLKDSSAWDDVRDNVPIFMEHEMWQTGEDEDARKVIVLPGEAPPEGGRLLYAIGEDELRATAERTNRNWEYYGKPIKLFFGHTHDPKKKKQQDQPDPIGYGVGARLGRWGPKKILGVLTKQYIARGYGKEARKYPERSPEFYPGSSEITALALLKTDPRLPMGMMAYSRADGAVCYSRGFDSPTYYGAGTMPFDDLNDDTPGTMPGSEADAGDEFGADDADANDSPDPTDEPDAEDGDLSPEEQKLADRLMKHLERTHPAIKFLCERFEQEMGAQPPADETAPPPGEPGMDTDAGAPGSSAPEALAPAPAAPAGPVPGEPPVKAGAGMAAAGPTNAFVPGGVKKDDRVDMARDRLAVQYGRLEKTVKGLSAKIGTLEGHLATTSEKYARSESRRIIAQLQSENVVVKNPQRLYQELCKLDDAGRKARYEDCCENYAREEGPTTGPAGGDFLDVAGSDLDGETGSEFASEDIDAAVAYCETNRIDPERDWDKAMAAVIAAKKKKPARR